MDVGAVVKRAAAVDVEVVAHVCRGLEGAEHDLEDGVRVAECDADGELCAQNQRGAVAVETHLGPESRFVVKEPVQQALDLGTGKCLLFAQAVQEYVYVA